MSTDQTTTDTRDHHRDTLAAQIKETETILTGLRAARDSQIRDDYQRGTSKYRLAKDWGVNENTITRIVTSTPSSTHP